MLGRWYSICAVVLTSSVLSSCVGTANIEISGYEIENFKDADSFPLEFSDIEPELGETVLRFDVQSNKNLNVIETVQALYMCGISTYLCDVHHHDIIVDPENAYREATSILVIDQTGKAGKFYITKKYARRAAETLPDSFPGGVSESDFCFRIEASSMLGQQFESRPILLDQGARQALARLLE